MPSVDILVKSSVLDSFRVQQVKGMFDIPDNADIEHAWKINVPVEERDWRIGLIVGASGSGKTTLAKHLFPDSYISSGFDWDRQKSIVDCFPRSCDLRQITQSLSSVGFSSPPQWLKPYYALSNGQQFRCDLARSLCLENSLVVFDEFTSVVDRTVAKIASHAVAKAVRNQDQKRFVAVSCHFDVEEWLNPDWVLNMSENSFQWRCLRQRPQIELTVHKASTLAWELFRGHHYLTSSIHKAARCFVACWDGRPVAFTSYLPLVHARVKSTKREHRTVVLPDFQGVGIGNRLSEWLGEYLKGRGFSFVSVSSHPSMIWHRYRSSKWVITRMGHVTAPGKKSTQRKTSCSRVTASCKYVG
jgi:energy-coupling factor transporter ATP-binding protein EcfA2